MEKAFENGTYVYDAYLNAYICEFAKEVSLMRIEYRLGTMADLQEIT